MQVRHPRIVQGGQRYKDCIKLAEFDKMKKTAFLINTSRGPIVNEDDLIIALSTNEIAGAGLDVYENEPLFKDHELRKLKNVVLTGHTGFVVQELHQLVRACSLHILYPLFPERHRHSSRPLTIGNIFVTVRGMLLFLG